MSFPVSPTNGQIAVVNNVAYEYASANTSWTRVLSIANVIQANVISANVLNVVQAFSITGNIATGNYFIGNGAFLTGIAAGYSNADVANYLPTYTGNLVSLTGPVTTTSNVTGGNILFGTGVVSGTGTVYAATVSTTGNVNSGYISTGEASVGNLFSGGYVSATGNITGNYILGNGALLTGVITSVANINNGTSNVTVVSSGGNVTVGVGGTGNIAVFSTDAVTVKGNVLPSANITYDLGTSTQRWRDLWLSNSTIYLGNAQISANATAVTITNPDGGTTVLQGATPSITGAVVSASGNVTGGNLLTGGLINATGNITGGNVNTNKIVGTGLTLVSTGDLSLSATGNINVNNEYINNVPTPVADGDAVNKLYVDNFVTGLNVHDAVTVATPTTLATITSGAVVYYNGPGANGIAATLTTTGTFDLIDTVNVQTAGTRILVLNEANAVTNGVYVWSNATAITRASDYNSLPEVEAGDFMFVTSGNVYGNTGWIQTSTVSNIGYAGNNITFTQFSGSGTYNAGTGLTLTGTTFSVNASQTQVTSVGTLGSLTVTANTTSGNLLTGGLINATSNITGGNLLTSGLISATGNITGGNLSGTSIVGTLTTASQTNITAVGTLGALTVTANTTSGNLLTAGLISAAGAITGAAITGSSLTVSTGNITGGNLILSGAIVDTTQLDLQTSAANANIVLTPNGTGNVNTGANLSVTGNVQAGNLRTAGLISATGNITGGNVQGTLHSGTTVSVTANVTGGNILTGGVISATGNGVIAGRQLTVGAAYTTFAFAGRGIVAINGTTAILEFASGTANYGYLYHSGTNMSLWNTQNGCVSIATNSVERLNISSTGVVSVTGNIQGGNLLTAGLISATSTIISAANITGGNLLTGGLISATGSLTVANANANIGTSTANATYNLGTGATLLGQTKNINIGTAGVASSNTIITIGTALGTGNVTFPANTTVVVSNTGGLALSAVGNITGGNLRTAGLISATGNITGGNLSGTSIVGTLTTAAQTNITSVGTLDSLTVTANTTTGNLLTGGLISATGNVIGNFFIGNGSQLTGIAASYGNANVVANLAALGSNPVSTTGNITSGNLLTGGLISATGNITGGNILGGANVNATTHTGTTVSVTANITGGNLFTGGLISATGNVIGNFFIGNGSQLTGIAASYGNSNVVANLAALGTNPVSTTGNITGGNILGGANVNATTHTGTTVSVTANITGGNLLTGGLVSATGNITGGNVNAGNITIAGDLISSLGATLTIDPATVGNAGLVVINGNLQVNGTTTTINSNVVSTNDLTVNYANNAINASAANGGGIEVGPIGSPYITWLYNSTANVWTSSDGISAVGNITGGNILGGANVNATTHTGTTVSVSANVTGGNVLTGGLISSTGNITGGNLSGTNITGTLATAAQTNITSVGTLGSLTVTANTTSGNLLTAGLISSTGNITGGNLSGTNIVGTLTTATQTNITSVGTLGALTVTANTTSGNLLTGGLISATGNITGGNLSGTNIVGTLTTAAQTNITSVGTLGSLTVTANTTSGNLLTGGLISAAGNITGGNVIANGVRVYKWTTVANTAPSGAVPGDNWYDSYADKLYLYVNDGTGNQWVDQSFPTTFASLTVSGNTSSGNLLTAGLVSAAGNITGNYIFGNGALLTGVITSVSNINNGTSNVTVVSSGGNVTVGVGGTGNVAVFSTDTLTVKGNVLPSANITYDLGTSTQRWKDLWLSNSTIYLGNAQISANATAVTITNPAGGATVLQGSTPSITGDVVSASGNVTGGNLLTGGLINATGNITGGNLRTAGLVSATGNITGAYVIGNGSQLTSLPAIKWTTVANTAPASPAPGDFWYNSTTGIKYQYINDGTGNAWVDQSYPTTFSTIAVTGNITGGNLSVSTGTITVGNVVNANGNGVGNIGSSSLYFNTVFAKATSAQYADLAEMYVADQYYPAGTVVEFGGNFEITASTQTHTTRIAGVVSTNPSYLMNSTLAGEYVLPIALTGRVPCKVTGTVRKGDQMVASSTPGIAMALNKQLYEPGCVIGKALENYNSDIVGTIEVAVGRY